MSGAFDASFPLCSRCWLYPLFLRLFISFQTNLSTTVSRCLRLPLPVLTSISGGIPGILIHRPRSHYYIRGHWRWKNSSTSHFRSSSCLSASSFQDG